MSRKSVVLSVVVELFVLVVSIFVLSPSVTQAEVSNVESCGSFEDANDSVSSSSKAVHSAIVSIKSSCKDFSTQVSQEVERQKQEQARIEAERAAQEEAERRAREEAERQEELKRSEQSQQPQTVTSNASSFKSDGVWYDGRFRYTYYSSRVLYHYRTPEWTVGSDGIYRDSSGYVVVASSDYPIGTVIDGTPFGSVKVYDSGCASGTLDVYTNF